jgi:hypothetical protein
MWYTANSTDSESDLIMKSIIFLFLKFTVYYFFRSSNSVDDKLVSVVKKEAKDGIVEKISDHLHVWRNSRFYQWIVFSELPNSV